MSELNKKGSALIELVVMCAILMIGILVTYKQFSSSISVQKKTLSYRNVGNEAKLVYIKEYLKDTDDAWICSCDKTDANNCNNNDNKGKDLVDEVPEKIQEVYDLVELYLLDCNTLQPISGKDELNNYVRKSKTCKDDSLYELVGVFNTNGVTTYGSVEYPYGCNNDGE